MSRTSQRHLNALQQQADTLTAQIRDTYGEDAVSLLLYTHGHGSFIENAMLVYSGDGTVLHPRHYGENPFELHTAADQLYGPGHWTLEPCHSHSLSGSATPAQPAHTAANGTPVSAADEDALPWPKTIPWPDA